MPYPQSAKFQQAPLAFYETAEAELARVRSLRIEDPIAWQDAVNTSNALVDAVKENDLEELRRVMANADEGELIQAFVVQAFVLALKATSLEIVEQLVKWGLPLGDEQLAQGLHLVCELTGRENFSNAWRILQLLVEGNSEGKMDLNAPRSMDGWTPLCIACANACLPLVFKLLELGADPNVITRVNDTPVSLAKRKLPDDTEEQSEARGIIASMLREYGGQEQWKEALLFARRPRTVHVKPSKAELEDGSELASMPVAAQPVSATHTNYRG
ncbi:unnamed protein product [Polarella glacialis]|uniref:Uncharacterized protein n=1 Tax=Polarella glacialis TaxID=89957 RepID=A0A813IN01_POLGL|nr:unnamed protein product [Polarella glacialis]CAE8651995.1 unnamed protein product [Polarella glacialis]